jgi:hypothetical protein
MRALSTQDPITAERLVKAENGNEREKVNRPHQREGERRD